MTESLLLTVGSGEVVSPQKLQQLVSEGWSLVEGRTETSDESKSFIFRRPHERRNGSE